MSSDTSSSSLPTVAITGGLGNLGSKLCRHFLSNGKARRVILFEHPNFANKPLPHEAAELVIGDAGNIDDPMFDYLKGVDAVVHFSAVNPYPNANWSESAQSMDHTFNIFNAAVHHKVRRIIFATSNHVMGGYKDDASSGAGSVHPDSEPRVGTIPLDPKLLSTSGDAVAYGAAKLAGERLAMTLGAMHAPTTTFVCLRIGWCQPGDNLPATLTAAGSPPEFLKKGGEEQQQLPQQSEDDKADESWFKRMWLSNRDFLSYFESALSLEVPTEMVESDGNPHRNIRKGFVLVNAMSRNNGAKWSLTETEQVLGVTSHDDSLK